MSKLDGALRRIDSLEKRIDAIERIVLFPSQRSRVAAPPDVCLGSDFECHVCGELRPIREGVDRFDGGIVCGRCADATKVHP